MGDRDGFEEAALLSSTAMKPHETPPEKIEKATTHFGYTAVDPDQKAGKVAEIFHSVASKYDLMNDLMSLGMHRWWKHFAITLGSFKRGQRVLDLAGGTGDLSRLITPIVGPQGLVILSDINESMLTVGRDRLLDEGSGHLIHYALADAESLPFAENSFDRVIMGFGLRNVTHKDRALAAIYQALKPGGSCLILEFSKPTTRGLTWLYDVYSFHLLPQLGEWVARDKKAYQYLVESIRMHPDQNTLKAMMETVGFEDCDVHNLSGGIVACHRGFKY